MRTSSRFVARSGATCDGCVPVSGATGTSGPDRGAIGSPVPDSLDTGWILGGDLGHRDQDGNSIFDVTLITHDHSLNAGVRL
jgi:hypothetical protein